MAHHQISQPSAFITPGTSHKATLRVGTWNVRTLNSQSDGIDRCEELRANLERYKIDICCISESKLASTGELSIGNWKLIYSGKVTGNRTQGVAVMMNDRSKRSLVSYQCVSERLMSVSFSLAKSKLHVVSAYAPTEDKREETKESFYQALQKLLDTFPKRDRVMIAGDFNAQLGGQDRSSWDGALGSFCLGRKITDNGTKLLSFCSANQLVVRNTFFQQKDIHLATWVGPSGVLANQIDHIIVRRFDAKFVNNCKVLRGTSLDSDHHLLRAECKLPPHAFQQRDTKARMRMNVDKLADTGTAKAFDERVHAAWQNEMHADHDHHESWEHFRTVLQQTQKELLLEHESPQKDWLSEQTKLLLDKKQAAWTSLVKLRMIEKSWATHIRDGRKKHSAGQVPDSSGPQWEKNYKIKRRTHCEFEKNRGAPFSLNRPSDGSSSNCGVASSSVAQSYGHLQCGSNPNCGAASPTEVKSYGQDQPRGMTVEAARQSYRASKNAARKAVAHDKRQHWQKLAAELEDYFQRGDLHKAYKAVKLRTDAAGKHKQMPDNMRRSDGTPAMGPQQNAQLKKQYFSDLLNVSRDARPDLSKCTLPEQTSAIDDSPPSLEETQLMIDRLKNHKAAGVDEIAAEILKGGGQSLVTWLHEIIVGVWASGVAPKEWKQALIVPVFKSGDATLLDNYRGISLLSIPGKVYSMLIGHRLKGWADQQLLDVQCGFRPARGCTDAIFGLRRIHEEALKKQLNLSTCFIDLSKAYDCINRELAWHTFELRGVPAKLISLLRDLHTDTECAIKGDHKAKDSWFEVRTGFKQGDVNAPLLFNLFIDTVVRCLMPLLQQSGVTFVYKMDGQLRESKTRDLQEIAWILMFADDIAFITDNDDQMQIALQIIDSTFSEWGLEMSLKKTKVMHLQADAGTECSGNQLSIARGQIEFVSQFKYLGSLSSVNLSMQPEIANRLAKAGGAFHGLVRLWGDKHLSRKVKLSIYKTVVQATLLYGCETWAVPKAMISMLDTFQMRCLRRICGISLWQKMTNESVRKMCSIEAISNIVQYRRLRWLGHLARMGDERLPKQLLFGTMLSTNNRSRKRGRTVKCWIDYARDDLSRLKISYHWYRLAQDRSKWRETICKLLEHT